MFFVEAEFVHGIDQVIRRKMGVDHSRLNIRMPQQLLNSRQVYSLHNKMTRERMSECMQFGNVWKTALCRNAHQVSSEFSLQHSPGCVLEDVIGLGVTFESLEYAN